MNQKIFETRQRAKELMESALEVWRQNDENERLEGIENDPTFRAIITALAYQANEIESDIERLREDVIREYLDSMVPYQLGHAVPATLVFETALQGDVPDIVMTSDMAFALGDGEYLFSPVLASHLYNCRVESINRIDGRRWKLSLDFAAPVSTIKGLTFAINGCNFKSMRVSYKGQTLPLICPWEYANIPFCQNFDMAASICNQNDIFNPSATFIDLYARHNIQMYIVDASKPIPLPDGEFSHLDLVFEFTDINSTFDFKPNNLSVNIIVLAEVRRRLCTLTEAQPIYRVSEGQFMHRLPQMFDNTDDPSTVEIRRVATDRFNKASLIHLISSLIDKVHSDFYAFQSIAKDVHIDRTKQQLIDILNNLRTKAIQSGQPEDNARGTYFILRDTSATKGTIMYLTTNGSKVNSMLSENTTLMVPLGLDQSRTHQIAPPIPGFDEVRDEAAINAISRYYTQTADRLVTPADIKIFCTQILTSRLGIPYKNIENISISIRPDLNLQSGYVIYVSILLNGNNYIKRNLEDRTQSVVNIIEKMIQVRSMSVYPVSVSLNLTDI